MTTKHHAVTAESVTPTSDNAPLAGRVIWEQAQQNSRDSADDDGARKALATMHARAALAACTLYELADGGYLVCHRNQSTFVPCLRCVGDLLRRIGGRP